MRTRGKSFLVVLCTMGVIVAGAVPATAQTAETASGSAHGVSLTGLLDIGPEPMVEATVPPDASAEDVLLEVPLDPVVFSGTASVESQASTGQTITPLLLAGPANARGYSLVEGLSALEGALTADVLASEAIATCVGDQAQFSTASQFQNVTLADTIVPLDELGGVIDLLDPVLDALEPLLGDSTLDIFTDQPNDVLLEVPELGIRVVAWETNWDGGTGTTDGSDTVFVNALRVTIGGVLGDLIGEQDLTVAHSEASADCQAEDPLRNVTKTASQETVAPGDTFDYTITIPNASETCTLDPVRVEDSITGPAGSAITGTLPPADTITGLNVTWNNVGPIAPGETVVLTIGVQVPDNAPDGALYSENLRVTSECDGRPVERVIDFDGPRVSAPTPSERPLPVTGGGLLAMLGGLATMGAGAALYRLRR